jgi:hypothetical protein
VLKKTVHRSQRDELLCESGMVKDKANRKEGVPPCSSGMTQERPLQDETDSETLWTPEEEKDHCQARK